MTYYNAIDAEDNGELTALLDEIQERGVAAENGRAFATWLEGVIHGLQKQRDDYRSELRDQSGGVIPEDLFPVGTPRYHPTKEAAQAVGRFLEHDPRVAQVAYQLEPYNGWVIVVVPAPADLGSWSPWVELQDGRKREPLPKNRPHQRLTAPDNRGSAPSGGGGPGKPQGPLTAPSKGATARVWEIADATAAQGGDRAAIIAACVAAGINAATAATQYSKWKKVRQ